MGSRKNKKGVNLILQGGVMAVALFAAYLCVCLRQIPLTNIWGDEGNSMYSAAFGLFSAAWLITSYAVPYTISSLLKPRLRQGQYKNAGKVMQTAFLYATISGAGIGAAVFFGSAYLAETVIREPLSALALRIFSAAVLVFAWNSVLRGFFLGNGAVFPVAVSLLAEQIVSLAAGFPLALAFQKYGVRVGALLQNGSFGASFAAAGFSAGIAAGAALSFLLLLMLYLATHSYYKKRNGKDSGRGRENMASVAAIFFACLLPTMFYGLFVKGYLLVEQILFRQFMNGSLGADAISRQWGVYFGKYKVFAALPVILAAAMVTTLRDRTYALSRKEDYQHMQELVRDVLKAVLTAVVPVSVMLGALASLLLQLCFPAQDVEEGAVMLLTGCITSVFFSAAYVFAQTLWGMKRTFLLFVCILPAFLIHAGTLYVMLEILHLDIFGVLYADIVYSFCLFAFLMAAVQKSCRFRYGLLRMYVPIGISAAVTGLILYVLSKALAGIPPLAVLIGLAALGTVIYYVLLILLRGTSQKELRMIPGGKWIIKAARAVRLL